MPVTAERPAPYAPTSAILDIVRRYRERGLQSPVTSEVLARAGVSESLIPRTLQALQTLDLLNADGTPTSVLEGLRLAPEAEFQRRLEDWLKASYADVFSFVDPTKDDATRIRDAFRSYQPVGQQERMVSLFQGLCSAAGLVSTEKTVQAARPVIKPRVLPNMTLRKAVTPKAQAHPPAINPAASSLPAPLAGLLAGLPTNGWTQAERDRFMSTFGAVLDFCFPPGKVTQKTENGDQD